MSIEPSTTTAADVVAYIEDPTSVRISFTQDPEEIRRRIDQQLLEAESLDDLLGGGSEVISAKQYLGKPFQLLSVDFRPSDYEEGEGLPFYVVAQIATAAGERQALSCGARSVVQKMALAASKGWLPAWVKIVEGKATAAGYKPLDLAKASGPDEF